MQPLPVFIAPHLKRLFRRMIEGKVTSDKITIATEEDGKKYYKIRMEPVDEWGDLTGEVQEFDLRARHLKKLRDVVDTYFAEITAEYDAIRADLTSLIQALKE